MSESFHDWQAIRTDYESGKMSLRQLAGKYQVSKSVIGERKYKEQWQQSRTSNRTDNRTDVSSQRMSNPSTRDVNAVGRVTLALQLRAKKLTYAHIAMQAGYGDASTCRKAVMRELERVVVHDVEELRREEADSLDRLEAICWKRLESADHEKAQMFAVDRIVAIKERRAKLMGLDKKIDDILGPQVVIEEVPMGYLEGPKV